MSPKANKEQSHSHWVGLDVTGTVSCYMLVPQSMALSQDGPGTLEFDIKFFTIQRAIPMPYLTPGLFSFLLIPPYSCFLKPSIHHVWYPKPAWRAIKSWTRLSDRYGW